MALAELNFGDANQYVILLQRFMVLDKKLMRPASGSEPVTGRFDEPTRSAVLDYQAANKIETTGRVAGKTWASIAGVPGPLPVVKVADLKSPNLPLLQSGDKNALIFVMQRLLFEYGDQATLAYLPRGIITKANLTGVFDETTRRAVTAFQTNRGIRADGIVGPNTWEKLFFPAGRVPAAV